MSAKHDLPIDERQVESVWDSMARAYDEFRSEWRSYANMIEVPAVMRLAGNLRGRRVLDLGCGSGEYSLDFARGGADVTGLDISSRALGIARQKSLEQNVRVNFVKGTISDLGMFRGCKFDIVFSSAAMHYIDDIEAVFKAVHGLLDDCGMFILSVIHPYYTGQYPLIDYLGEDMYAVFQMRYFNRKIRQYIPPWAKNCDEKCGRLLSYHYTAGDYFGALRRSGFFVDELVEPEPLPEWKDTHPRRYYEMKNFPLFMIFGCYKIKGR